MAVVPDSANAASTTNTTNQTAGGTTTLAFTVSSGSNRLLIVSIATWNNGGTGSGCSSVTYNGVAMTAVGNGNSNGAFYTEQWALVSPATGTNNIVATVSGKTDKLGMSAISFSGADQTTGIDVSTHATGTSGTVNPSMTTTAASEYLVDIVSHLSANAPSAQSGTSLLADTSSGVSTASQYSQAAIVNEPMATHGPWFANLVHNNGTSAAYQTAYYQLNNGINQYADLEYTGTLPSSFTASADLQMSTTSGADASWFYFGCSASPQTETDSTGIGYLIQRNDFNNYIRLMYGGSMLATYTYTKDTSWDTLSVAVSGNTFTISYKGSVVITYTDTTRTLPGSKYGWGARSGGTANTHNIRNLLIPQTSGGTSSQGYTYPDPGDAWAVSALAVKAAGGAVTSSTGQFFAMF